MQIPLYSGEFKLLIMAATATPSLQIAAAKPCVSASRKIFKSSTASFGLENRGRSAAELKSLSVISATKLSSQGFNCIPLKSRRMVTKAMSGASDNAPLPGLPIDLRGFLLVHFCNLCEVSSYAFVKPFVMYLLLSLSALLSSLDFSSVLPLIGQRLNRCLKFVYTNWHSSKEF